MGNQQLKDTAILGKTGSYSARYCYSVWLRHMVMAHKNGLSTRPTIIAELGPGNSLGVGLVGLLLGARKYYAFDIVHFAKNDRNLQILDELICLLKNRENIPGEDEFPRVKPYLDSYEFPQYVYDDAYLDAVLTDRRIHAIRNALITNDNSESIINYKVPWDGKSIIYGSVDMIYSQSVLEHIDNLQEAYQSMYDWLAPDGYISHQIDFKCHGTADLWNGHWTYSDGEWDQKRKKFPFLLNREPHSKHIGFLEKSNFSIVCDEVIQQPSGIPRIKLNDRFSNFSEDDLTTANAFIQASKQ